MTRVALGLFAALPATAASAWAHDGQPVTPHDVWTAWSLEPAVLLGIGLAAGAYARGVRVLWRRAGVGRGVRRHHAAAFAGGVLALFTALVTPIDTMGDALFAAHMVQHLMLMLVAAPLLLLGAPIRGLLWALPARARRAAAKHWHRLRPAGRSGGRNAAPLAAWWLGAITLWTWHVPRFYDAALRNDAIHALEHASFLLAALLFWWPVVHPSGRFRRGDGIGLVYLFTAAMQNGVLGALITLGRRPWYAAHLETTRAWGLSPLEDQQIAGAIMWVPASVVYLVALSVLFVLWLRAAERRARLGQAAWPLLAFAALLCGCARADGGGARSVPGGDPAAGVAAIERYGCGSCHTIPGVRGARGQVGPPLERFARRGFIAGALANTPAHLITWIMDPQSIEPGTIMPDMDVTAQEARDIAAYLYTLE